MQAGGPQEKHPQGPGWGQPQGAGRWARAACIHSPGCGRAWTPVSLCLLVTQTLRSAALEDCALCQETLSSSELAAKTRDGDLEGGWGALGGEPRPAMSFLSQTAGPVKTVPLQLEALPSGRLGV